MRPCAVEMHMDISKEPFYARVLGQNAAHQDLGLPLQSLRYRNAHGHVTRAILYENFRVKGTHQDLGLRYVRACTVEMHMDMSQEPFYTRILG